MVRGRRSFDDDDDDDIDALLGDFGVEEPTPHQQVARGSGRREQQQQQQDPDDFDAFMAAAGLDSAELELPEEPLLVSRNTGRKRLGQKPRPVDDDIAAPWSEELSLRADREADFPFGTDAGFVEEPLLVQRGAGRRRLGAKPLRSPDEDLLGMDDDPLADMSAGRHGGSQARSLTPGHASASLYSADAMITPRDSADGFGASSAGGGFEEELLVVPKAKKRLGGGKAKAKPKADARNDRSPAPELAGVDEHPLSEDDDVDDLLMDNTAVSRSSRSPMPQHATPPVTSKASATPPSLAADLGFDDPSVLDASVFPPESAASFEEQLVVPKRGARKLGSKAKAKAAIPPADSAPEASASPQITDGQVSPVPSVQTSQPVPSHQLHHSTSSGATPSGTTVAAGASVIEDPHYSSHHSSHHSLHHSSHPSSHQSPHHSSHPSPHHSLPHSSHPSSHHSPHHSSHPSPHESLHHSSQHSSHPSPHQGSHHSSHHSSHHNSHRSPQHSSYHSPPAGDTTHDDQGRGSPSDQRTHDGTAHGTAPSNGNTAIRSGQHSSPHLSLDNPSQGKPHSPHDSVPSGSSISPAQHVEHGCSGVVSTPAPYGMQRSPPSEMVHSMPPSLAQNTPPNTLHSTQYSPHYNLPQGTEHAQLSPHSMPRSRAPSMQDEFPQIVVGSPENNTHAGWATHAEPPSASITHSGATPSMQPSPFHGSQQTAFAGMPQSPHPSPALTAPDPLHGSSLTGGHPSLRSSMSHSHHISSPSVQFVAAPDVPHSHQSPWQSPLHMASPSVAPSEAQSTLRASPQATGSGSVHSALRSATPPQSDARSSAALGLPTGSFRAPSSIGGMPGYPSATMGTPAGSAISGHAMPQVQQPPSPEFAGLAQVPAIPTFQSDRGVPLGIPGGIPAVPVDAGSAVSVASGDTGSHRGVQVPNHPGFPQPPSGLRMGLPPGSPLTATEGSDVGSTYAQPWRRHRTDASLANFGELDQERAANATDLHAAPAKAGLNVAESNDKLLAPTGSVCASDHAPSLFGSPPDFAGAQVAGISAFPPLAAVPSADLLAKFAYSEAKVRQLELQLEDCDTRWEARLSDQKQQADAGRESLEQKCHRLEADLVRARAIHDDEIRHLKDSKKMVHQNFEVEKENIRSDERRRWQLELEKVREDHSREIEDLRKQHERALAIEKQQTDMEAEILRKGQTGEQVLTKLAQQVQGQVLEIEKMSRHVATDKSLEWNARERKLDESEKRVREKEAKLAVQEKGMEDQRQRVADLVRRMEESQLDDRSIRADEQDRLQKEHQRLLELQRTVREADRSNKETLKRSLEELEQGRRKLEEDGLRTESEVSTRSEELDLQERHMRREAERLKVVHNQIEMARQNASRKIRETEMMVANERRCLMQDIEVFEEKRRLFAAEVEKVDGERRIVQEERQAFEKEIKSVGAMASEVQRRSLELKDLHNQAEEAHAELQRLREQLSEERSAQGSELEKLKTMQTLIEQQRLQLLNTENQFRMRGIEDIDLMTMARASLPPEPGPLRQLLGVGPCLDLAGAGQSTAQTTVAPNAGQEAHVLDWGQIQSAPIDSLNVGGAHISGPASFAHTHPAMWIAAGATTPAIPRSVGSVGSIGGAMGPVPGISDVHLAALLNGSGSEPQRALDEMMRTEQGEPSVPVPSHQINDASMMAADTAAEPLLAAGISAASAPAGPLQVVPSESQSAAPAMPLLPTLSAPPSGSSVCAMAGARGVASLPVGCRPQVSTACRIQGVGTSCNRMELQTLLRSTRESSGEMNMFIQEHRRFLGAGASIPHVMEGSRPQFIEDMSDPSFAALQPLSSDLEQTSQGSSAQREREF